MFKKWFIRCVMALVLVVAAISVTLAYQFTQSVPGKHNVSAALPEGSPKESAPRSVAFAKLKPVAIVKGQPVDPFDFLDGATSSDVVAFFREEISTDEGGVYDLTLTLNDGTRRADVLVTLYILDAEKTVTREAGTQDEPLTADDFVAYEEELPVGMAYSAELLTGLGDIDFMNVGRYDVSLMVNGVELQSALQLVDTAAPTAKATALTVNLGTSPAPQDFVTDISDTTGVTVSYAGDAPDVFISGERLVKVLLEDDYGNTSEYNASLTVLPNTGPPVFGGMTDFEAFLGDPVMYRLGVTAEDSFGNPLEFEVDSTAVDISVPGEYPVVYSVMDADGNRTVGERVLKVVDLTADAIEGMITEILNRIIEDGMSQREQAEAVFNWIKNSVSYVSDAPKDSVYEGAYRALRYRQGDCFTFYAVAEVFLTRLEIPNERVTRIDGATNHYWNLVNADDGGWYHFDSTHNAVHSINRFMFTDSEAEEYTAIIQAQTGARNYYTYDKTLHPEVVQ